MSHIETYYSEREARQRFGRKVNVDLAHTNLIVAGLIAGVLLIWLKVLV